MDGNDPRPRQGSATGDAEEDETMSATEVSAATSLGNQSQNAQDMLIILMRNYNKQK